jgi:peptidoglycan hydrolase CwlO-like protein
MREAVISNCTVQSIGPRLVFCFLILLPLLVTGVQDVRAEPRDLTQARSQAAGLEAQVDELKGQALILKEKYEAAANLLAQTEADVADNAALLAQVQQDQLSAEGALGDRLVEIYKQGPGNALEILLGSTSLAHLMDRVALLERIGSQDAALVRQVASYRAQVVDQREKLTATLEKRQAAAEQAEAARHAVTQKLAQTEQLLIGKEAEIAQLKQAWQAQQEEEARLRQKRQAKLQAALADAQAAAQAAAKNQADNDVADGRTGETGDTAGATGGGGSSGYSGSGTSGDGSQVHQPGAPNVLKPEQIALAAQKAGFAGENLVIAVAVAMAESGSDANAVGRLRTYGLWQILASAHPDLINPSNPDASRWYDPYVNARFAWKISGNGTDWRPWSVYTSGAYLTRMDKARAGAELLLGSPQSVVPPSVK